MNTQSFVRTGTLIVLFFALLVTLAGPHPAQGKAKKSSVPDQIVVKLRPTEGGMISAVNLLHGTETIASVPGNPRLFLLRSPAGVNAEELLAALSRNPLVEYAELNYLTGSPEALNGDYIYAWGGKDSSGMYEQSAHTTLQLDAAHQISRGAGTVVAVVDTGVQLDHPALADRWTEARYDFVDADNVPVDASNGIDEDGDGRVDESVGHGTHVAGIVNLIAPDAHIMPLRVLNSDGLGTSFDVASAILYAVQNGADVINLSLGSLHESAMVQDAVAQAVSAGIVIAGAAGNMNADVKIYPAADSCVIGVTAVDPEDYRSSFASYGGWIGMAAPGEQIYSTLPTDGYGWWSGTSMATPFLSGHAALLLGADSSLTLDQIGTLIAATADSLDTLNPDYAGKLGSGRLDIYEGLDHLSSGTWPASTSNLFANCGGN